MKELFLNFIYDPLYNALVLFIDIIPGYDVGLAIIAVTVFIKLVLFPLSKKAVRTQMVIKKIQPELDELKKKHKDDRQQQAQKMMELYKENNLNPFSGFLVILIQLPVIIGLYWVFYKGGLPEINTDMLYSFVPIPQVVNMDFLGLVDMGGKSFVLAALAGLSQYVQIKYSLPPIAEKKDSPSLKDDLARSFQLQMRYMMPILITVFAYVISAAVALYWVTSNMFAIGQELYMRKKVRNTE